MTGVIVLIALACIIGWRVVMVRRGDRNRYVGDDEASLRRLRRELEHY